MAHTGSSCRAPAHQPLGCWALPNNNYRGPAQRPSGLSDGPAARLQVLKRAAFGPPAAARAQRRRQRGRDRCRRIPTGCGEIGGYAPSQTARPPPAHPTGVPISAAPLLPASKEARQRLSPRRRPAASKRRGRGAAGHRGHGTHPSQSFLAKDQGGGGGGGAARRVRWRNTCDSEGPSQIQRG